MAVVVWPLTLEFLQSRDGARWIFTKQAWWGGEAVTISYTSVLYETSPYMCTRHSPSQPWPASLTRMHSRHGGRCGRGRGSQKANDILTYEKKLLKRLLIDTPPPTYPALTGVSSACIGLHNTGWFKHTAQICYAPNFHAVVRRRTLKIETGVL